MGCALKAIASFQMAPHWYSLLMWSFLLPLVHLLQRVISPSRSSFLGEGIDTAYLFTIFIISLNRPKILWKFIVRLKCDVLLIMITTRLSLHQVFHFYSLACFVAYNILTFVPSFYCSYTLYALTFYGRQHYTCKIRFFGKWVYYDGLQEKQCPGSGLFEQHTAQLGMPSHCFYVQLWGTQFRSGLKRGWRKITRAIFQSTPWSTNFNSAFTFVLEISVHF